MPITKSLWRIVCVAVGLTGLALAQGGGPVTRPTGCDKIDPLVGKDTLDHFDRPPAVIRRSFQNRTAIEISWTLDATDEHLADLCGYTIHWFQVQSQTEKHVVVKEPNVTSHLVNNLEPGTKYQFYVVTYYTTQHEPYSWKLITFTDGCGPDVPLCHPKGSEGCNMTTGDCICKTTQTTGIACDTCPRGFYMHPLGCTSCDYCPKDGVTSTGTCRPATDPKDTMMCDCIHPYAGKHCRDCVEGYYWSDEMCSPCNCFWDKDDGSPLPKCDPFSGKCVCAKDRAGDKCEKCGQGYFGNPLTEGCIHTRNAGVTALIVIVILIMVAVAAVTAYLVCRRHISEKIRKGFWRAHLREDYDKVNFTTLEEEPEYEPGRVRHISA